MIDDRAYLNLVLTRRARYILQGHSVTHRLLVGSPEDDHYPMTGFVRADRRYCVGYQTHASARLSSRILGTHPRGEDKTTKTMKACDRWALLIQSILLLEVVAILCRPGKSRFFIIVYGLTILEIKDSML